MSPHLGQHTGKAWISCSKPSTGHETARDYSAFPRGRDCGSRACLPWRKGGVGGHPTAAPPLPTVVLEKMDQALRTVQGGRRSWKHTAFTSLFPSQWGSLKTRDEAEQAAGGRGRWDGDEGAVDPEHRPALKECSRTEVPSHPSEAERLQQTHHNKLTAACRAAGWREKKASFSISKLCEA